MRRLQPHPQAVVTLEQQRGVQLVRCHGDLDISAQNLFAASLTGLPDGTTTSIVVDLSGVRFMDCAALRVLVPLARDCRDAGIPISLAAPPPLVRRLLVTLHLGSVLPMVPTVQTALDRGAAGRVEASAAPRSRHRGPPGPQQP